MFSLTRRTLKRNVTQFIKTNRLYAGQSQAKAVSDEYTEKPEYPEILEISREARFKREKQSWHDDIQSLPTVEEKLIKINMPRYYGYRTIGWSSEEYPYNCLPITQHYTRTIFESYDKLITKPKVEGEGEGEPKEPKDAGKDSFITGVSNNIKDALECSYEYFKEKYGKVGNLTARETDKIFGQIIVENLNRVLINYLSADLAYLSEVEVDLNPRHEAFWVVGGVNPPKDVVESRKGIKWQEDTADKPVDRLIQYTGEPYLALRHKLPLPEVKSFNDGELKEKSKDVPLYKFDPRTLGYKKKYCHATNIPGFWPGSPNGFGIMSYQPRDHMVDRNPKYETLDFEEVLHAQAIQSSFAWLLAQANYKGFSTYNDVTYPMATQTVITNGKLWSFYRYQLNTTLLHSDNVFDNPKVNFCWGTKEMKLFEEFDSTGKCVGFNEDVVKMLVEFYTNVPVERGINLQPYLSTDTAKVADIPDDDKREFLERTFKHLMSNRPRHLELPEVYLWERIYKIDNATRPMEAKRRFFELGINPWRRTLDQHALEYIPRALRPNGPKSKPKFKKTYYP